MRQAIQATAALGGVGLLLASMAFLLGCVFFFSFFGGRGVGGLRGLGFKGFRGLRA